MDRSGWFAKGTKLSWISNYCISLIEIQSKLKTVSHSQAIVYGRPVELKIKDNSSFYHFYRLLLLFLFILLCFHIFFLSSQNLNTLLKKTLHQLWGTKKLLLNNIFRLLVQTKFDPFLSHIIITFVHMSLF